MYMGKICVITGALRGVGPQIARKFASYGCGVAFMDKDKDAGKCFAELLRKRYGVEVFFFHGDTCSEEDLEIFAGAVIGQYGRVDFFVNNTSYNGKGAMDGMDSFVDMQKALQVSTITPYVLDKAFKSCLQRGGVEVYMVPCRANFREEDEAGYRLVKEAVEAFAGICANSYQGYVRVKCVCPDLIKGTEQDLTDTIYSYCEEYVGKRRNVSGRKDGDLFKMMAYPVKDGWNIV